MPPHIDISRPFEDPVLVFMLMLFIVLFAPIVLRRLRVPGIVGLIIAGVIVGPHGLNLLSRNDSVELFGTVGLLYIMFLAGLEVDIVEFKRNRHRSLLFGFFTFILPLSLGLLVSHFLLKFSFRSSLLLASMFASHTLVAYPIVSRLGLLRRDAVTVAIGGTIITDTAVLLVLAVIANSVQGELSVAFWIQIAVSLVVFLVLILWGFPRIAAWFFRNVEGEGVAQYIFVMLMAFAAAFLAKLAGVEPIIGVFLAGLALNSMIPFNSALMNRIEFVGNALFVPIFLISVGMLVDVRVLFGGPDALLLAGTLLVVAFLGKWLAALAAQLIFRYSLLDRNLIFGLSSAHAAATLAVIVVGFRLGLFSLEVLNGTILLILVSCLVSSIVVERTGRRIARAEHGKVPEGGVIRERILVPVSNEDTLERLVDLALMIKNPASDDPLYVLAVVRDDDMAKERVRIASAHLGKAITQAAATDKQVQVVPRIDLNVADGIVKAIKELMITQVILGWNATITRTQKIFGRIVDKVLANTDQMVMVSKIIFPLNTVRRIVIVAPPNAELERGFGLWLHTVRTLSRQAGAPLLCLGPSAVLSAIEEAWKGARPAVEFKTRPFEDWEDFLVLARDVTANDLLIIVSARRGTLSHNRHLDRVPKHLSRHFEQSSFVIVYPEQYPSDRE